MKKKTQTFSALDPLFPDKKNTQFLFQIVNDKKKITDKMRVETKEKQKYPNFLNICYIFLSRTMKQTKIYKQQQQKV